MKNNFFKGQSQFLVAMLLLISNPIFSQVKKTANNDTTIIVNKATQPGDIGISDAPFESEDHDSAAKKVEVQARFPGGDSAFRSFIANNFNYPARCLDEGISGYVLLRFIVDTKGNISNVTVIEETKSCKEFSQEAIRVLKMSPRWIPGMVNGKFVKSYRVIPIKLSLG